MYPNSFRSHCPFSCSKNFFIINYRMIFQVSRFPFSVSIVAGGVTALSPEQFSATHPQVPAQSLLYELIQAPRGKLSLRVDGRQKAAFTQEDVTSYICTFDNYILPIKTGQSIKPTSHTMYTIIMYSRASFSLKKRSISILVEPMSDTWVTATFHSSSR